MRFQAPCSSHATQCLHTPKLLGKPVLVGVCLPDGVKAVHQGTLRVVTADAHSSPAGDAAAAQVSTAATLLVDAAAVPAHDDSEVPAAEIRPDTLAHPNAAAARPICPDLASPRGPSWQCCCTQACRMAVHHTHLYTCRLLSLSEPLSVSRKLLSTSMPCQQQHSQQTCGDNKQQLSHGCRGILSSASPGATLDSPAEQWLLRAFTRCTTCREAQDWGRQ